MALPGMSQMNNFLAAKIPALFHRRVAGRFQHIA
jgi:hypothetical protein